MLPANVRLNFKIGMLIALMTVLVVAVACETDPVEPETPVVPTNTAVVVPTVTVTIVPPDPTETSASAGTYRMGTSQGPSTRNYFNFFGGPGGDVWTGYTLDGVTTTLYDYLPPAIRLGASPGRRLSFSAHQRERRWQPILDIRGQAEGKRLLERWRTDHSR